LHSKRAAILQIAFHLSKILFADVGDCIYTPEKKFIRTNRDSDAEKEECRECTNGRKENLIGIVTNDEVVTAFPPDIFKDVNNNPEASF
jgi:hypothetical protein